MMRVYESVGWWGIIRVQDGWHLLACRMVRGPASQRKPHVSAPGTAAAVSEAFRGPGAHARQLASCWGEHTPRYAPAGHAPALHDRQDPAGVRK